MVFYSASMPMDRQCKSFDIICVVVHCMNSVFCVANFYLVPVSLYITAVCLCRFTYCTVLTFL